MDYKLQGRRVVLHRMKDPYTTLRPGDKGTVEFMDDLGQLRIQWDNGSYLALIPSVDDWDFIPNEDPEYGDEAQKQSHNNNPDR